MVSIAANGLWSTYSKWLLIENLPFLHMNSKVDNGMIDWDRCGSFPSIYSMIWYNLVFKNVKSSDVSFTLYLNNTNCDQQTFNG